MAGAARFGARARRGARRWGVLCVIVAAQLASLAAAQGAITLTATTTAAGTSTTVIGASARRGVSPNNSFCCELVGWVQACAEFRPTSAAARARRREPRSRPRRRIHVAGVPAAPRRNRCATPSRPYSALPAPTPRTPATGAISSLVRARAAAARYFAANAYSNVRASLGAAFGSDLNRNAVTSAAAYGAAVAALRTPAGRNSIQPAQPFANPVDWALYAITWATPNLAKSNGARAKRPTQQGLTRRRSNCACHQRRRVASHSAAGTAAGCRCHRRRYSHAAAAATAATATTASATVTSPPPLSVAPSRRRRLQQQDRGDAVVARH